MKSHVYTALLKKQETKYLILRSLQSTLKSIIFRCSFQKVIQKYKATYVAERKVVELVDTPESK